MHKITKDTFHHIRTVLAGARPNLLVVLDVLSNRLIEAGLEFSNIVLVERLG